MNITLIEPRLQLYQQALRGLPVPTVGAGQFRNQLSDRSRAETTIESTLINRTLAAVC